jgi:hypothetical protein
MYDAFLREEFLALLCVLWLCASHISSLGSNTAQEFQALPK